MEPNTGFNYRDRARRGGALLKLSRLFSRKREDAAFAHCYCSDESRELLDRIRSAKDDWLSAYANFEYVSSRLDVDYYTYQIKACQARYEQLLKQAKDIGLKVDFVDCLDGKSRRVLRN